VNRQRKEKILVTIELPGMSQEVVEVSLSKDILTIKREKKTIEEEAEERAFYLERTFGSFNRSVACP